MFVPAKQLGVFTSSFPFCERSKIKNEHEHLKVTGHLVGKTTILSRLKVAWKSLEYLVAFLVIHFFGTEDAEGTEYAECSRF